MSKAVYPGTFDPITLGHIDIITRASKMFDELVVGVLNNKAKNPLFTIDERISMIKDVTKHLPNVSVTTFEGLSVDFAANNGANTIIRGVRIVSDFEFELQMSQTNRALNENVDTVFLTTSPEYAYMSSSGVKEVAAFNGDISLFLPESVARLVKEKYK